MHGVLWSFSQQAHSGRASTSLDPSTSVKSGEQQQQQQQPGVAWIASKNAKQR